MRLKAKVRRAEEDFLTITEDEFVQSKDTQKLPKDIKIHKKKYEDEFELPRNVSGLFGEGVVIKFHARFEVVQLVDVNDESVSKKLVEVTVDQTIIDHKFETHSSRKFLLPHPKEGTKREMREELSNQTRHQTQKLFLNRLELEIRKQESLQKQLLETLKRS